MLIQNNVISPYRRLNGNSIELREMKQKDEYYLDDLNLKIGNLKSKILSAAWLGRKAG